MSEVKTLVTLVLGGMFDHRELGDIDILYEAPACEQLQRELVNSIEDVHVELVSRTDYDSAQAELSALREELAAHKETVALFESEYSKQSLSLTSAEQRNARYESLLRQIIPCLAMSTNTTAPTYIRQIVEAMPQPTESALQQLCDHLNENIESLQSEIERLKGWQGEPVVSVPRAWLNQVALMQLSHEDMQDKAVEFLCEPCDEEASQPAPVSVVMSFDFEHPLSKEKRTITLTKRNVFDGMEDYFYDRLGEQICQCESVGETNVVDCNCDEYVHDFEIVSACLDKVKEMNQ